MELKTKMKVKTIELIEGHDVAFINKTLQTTMNDFLLNKSFIKVSFESLDSPMDFVYRLFFETIFLRKTFHKSTCEPINTKLNFVPGNLMYNVIITLDEAIGFIQNVTSAALKKYNHDLYSSIENIIETLKEYLIVENPQQDFYLSSFKRMMGMDHFETNPLKACNYDEKRIEVIRDKVPNGPIADIVTFKQPIINYVNGDIIGEIESDENAVGELYSYYSYKDDTETQIWLNVKTTYDICMLIGELTSRRTLVDEFKNTIDVWYAPYICNVKRMDDESYMVLLYYSSYDSSLSPYVQNVITDTYKAIMG